MPADRLRLRWGAKPSFTSSAAAALRNVHIAIFAHPGGRVEAALQLRLIRPPTQFLLDGKAD